MPAHIVNKSQASERETRQTAAAGKLSLAQRQRQVRHSQVVVRRELDRTAPYGEMSTQSHPTPASAGAGMCVGPSHPNSSSLHPLRPLASLLRPFAASVLSLSIAVVTAAADCCCCCCHRRPPCLSSTPRRSRAF